ncbi:sodium:solute symporter family protein [Halosquirtibacter xylanolyticus]|uniref:sodium:solute symporter family protein n=1 Tax=Halosquirtibacter xylanolyticus TaxID=3374599 RepID=UPI003748F86F|nr:sodium:solute symporter family protein [Prolixibacteraceae bacterium]
MISTTSLSIIFLSVYTILIISVGLYNRKSENSEDYFLASRRLPSWLLAITFIASWWGGGSAIDLVDHAFRNGINSFWIYGVPVLLSTFLMFLFAKAIRKVGTVSQPQLMEQRYNRWAGLLLTVFIIVFMVLTASVQAIVIGKFFHSFFGISYNSGILIGTGIVLSYSFFGGFKGVVLTDFIQFVFFLFTAIYLFYVAYDTSGGLENVSRLAEKKGQIGYTSLFHNVSDQLAYVITFGASWMIQANIWQRISAAKNATSAKKMMLISFFAFIPLYLMVTFTGMFSLVSYSSIPTGGIVPDMVRNISNPLLSSIIFVGLCSAIMSTMDSLLNTGAMSLTIDVFKRYISPSVSPQKNVMVGRVSTLIMGGLAALIAMRVDSVLKISWIGSDFLTTGAFIPLVLGFIWKRGSATGAILSMLFGLLFSSYNLLVAMGLSLPVCWEIASSTQAIVGVLISLLIFISTSLLFPDKNDKADLFVNKAGMTVIGKSIELK